MTGRSRQTRRSKVLVSSPPVTTRFRPETWKLCVCVCVFESAGETGSEIGDEAHVIFFHADYFLEVFSGT